jgi:hypothetical protein
VISLLESQHPRLILPKVAGLSTQLLDACKANLRYCIFELRPHRDQAVAKERPGFPDVRTLLPHLSAGQAEQILWTIDAPELLLLWVNSVMQMKV